MNGDTTASIVNAVFVSSRPDRARSALVVRPYRAHLDAEPGLSARGTTESPSLPLRRHIESPFHTPIPVTTERAMSAEALQLERELDQLHPAATLRSSSPPVPL